MSDINNNNELLKENNQYKIYQIKSVFYILTILIKNIFINRLKLQNNITDKILSEFQESIKNKYNSNDALKYLIFLTTSYLKITNNEKVEKENKIITKIEIILKHVETNYNINGNFSTFNNDMKMLLECVDEINSNDGIYTKEKIDSILNNNKSKYKGDNENEYPKNEEINKIIKEADKLYEEGQFKKSYQLYDSLKFYNNMNDNESCTFYLKHLYNLGIGKCGLKLYLDTKINSYTSMDHRLRLNDYIASIEESITKCPLINSEPYFILAQLLLKLSNSNYKISIELLNLALLLEPTTSSSSSSKVYKEYLDQCLIEKEELDENIKNSIGADGKSDRDFKKYTIKYLEKYKFNDWFKGTPIQSIDDKRDGAQLFLDNENEMAMQWFKREDNKSLFSLCYLGKLLSSGKKGIEVDYKSSISLLLEGSLMIPKNQFEMSELSKIRLELAHRFSHGLNGVNASDSSRALYYLHLITQEDANNCPSCFYLTALTFMESSNHLSLSKSNLDKLIIPLLTTGIKLGCKKSPSILNKFKELNK